MRPRSFTLRLLGAVVAIGVASGGKPATAQINRAVTFDQVVEYLELQVPESRLIELVGASPTSFVLGADQLRILRAAGASEALLQALQSKAPTVAAGSDVTDFVVILDCSGSMNDKLPDGGSKWGAARQAAMDLVESIPEGRQVSLIVYGTDVARKCHSIDVLRSLVPLSDSDKADLTRIISKLKAVGHTPIANSLLAAGEQLASAAGMASIVLITDGMESCHGDPAAIAGQLVGRFPNLTGGINVVGFCLGDEESRQVARIAEAGHGEFYSASTADQLLESIRKIEASVIQPAPVEAVTFEGLSALERLLIEQLSDADIDVRTEAANTVGERKILAAVPALKNLIAHAEYGVGLYGDIDREAAIDAILALDAEQAGPALSAALTSASFKVRVWAAAAIRDNAVTAAIPTVEKRLLALGDDDISPRLINGTDEADTLFSAMQTLAPESLEGVIVSMIRGRSSNAKAWATEKARQLP